MGSNEPMEDFQIMFASKYFPDRAHLLATATAGRPTEPDNLPQSTPVSTDVTPESSTASLPAARPNTPEPKSSTFAPIRRRLDWTKPTFKYLLAHNKILLWGGIGVAAILVIIATVTYLALRKAGPIENIPVLHGLTKVTLTPKDCQIAYMLASTEHSNVDISVVDQDGSNVRQLTSNGAQNIFPAWSPDDTHIVFSSGGYGKPFQIAVMDAADGSNLHILTSVSTPDNAGPAYTSPTWSPDGRYIAFIASDSGKKTTQIDIMNADGSETHALTPTFDINKITAGGLQGPILSWSPDGKQIAFTAVSSFSAQGIPLTMQIYLINADGSNLHVLNSNGAFPAWSPDGKHIAFNDSNIFYPGTSVGAIYVVNTDSGSVHKLASNGVFPAWSPDGQQIAFVSSADSNWKTGQIFVMDMDGGNVRQLTSAASGGILPIWSPDGTHIAFVSSNDPSWKTEQINVMDADGSNVRQLVPGGAQPTWSPLCK